MTSSGIQGQRVLQIAVVGCNRLGDTEWVSSRQDPFVHIEYGSSKFRTQICRNGGKDPSFKDKFEVSLIQGLREMNVYVWNSNHLGHYEYIGGGRILLQKVLSSGYDDQNWAIQGRNGMYAGEVRVILQFINPQNPYSYGQPQQASLISPYPSYPYTPTYPPTANPYTQYACYPPQPSQHPNLLPPPLQTTVYPPPAPAAMTNGYPPVGTHPSPPMAYPPPEYAQQSYPVQSQQYYYPPDVYPPRPSY